MLRDPVSRVITVTILLIVLFGLMIGYGMTLNSPQPEINYYPKSGELYNDYQSYLNERVKVTGWVVSTDPVVIKTWDGQGGDYLLTITGAHMPVETGTRISVFGVVKTQDTVEAHRIVKYPQYGVIYTRLISFLAGVWVAIRALRHWTFDLDRFGIVRRPKLTGIPDHILSWIDRRTH